MVDSSPTRIHFRFYAAAGRMHAENVTGKIVDLGPLAPQADGQWAWCLDGNGLSGTAPSAEAAMRDAAGRMGYLYLDGQFTAVSNERRSPALDLSNAVAVEVILDELAPGQRVEDARV